MADDPFAGDRQLTYKARDQKQGLMLYELSAIVKQAEEAGMSPTSQVQSYIGWSAQIQTIAIVEKPL